MSRPKKRLVVILQGTTEVVRKREMHIDLDREVTAPSELGSRKRMLGKRGEEMDFVPLGLKALEELREALEEKVVKEVEADAFVSMKRKGR